MEVVSCRQMKLSCLHVTTFVTFTLRALCTTFSPTRILQKKCSQKVCAHFEEKMCTYFTQNVHKFAAKCAQKKSALHNDAICKGHKAEKNFGCGAYSVAVDYLCHDFVGNTL